jgi:hypothetical protein
LLTIARKSFKKIQEIVKKAYGDNVLRGMPYVSNYKKMKEGTPEAAVVV